MTDRILSPDGTQQWNGSTWVPVTDPAAHDVGAAPHGPETALAGQVAPAPASSFVPSLARTAGAGSAPVLEAEVVDNSWDLTKSAWRIALTPGFFIVGALYSDGTYITAISAIGVVIATIATLMDAKSLQRRGLDVGGGYSVAVLFIYVLGAPAYLIHRTQKAHSTSLIPVAWFAGALLAAFVLFSPGMSLGPTVDVSSIEDSLTTEFTEGGVRGALIDCPDDVAYDAGDMVICDVTTRDGRESEIVLEMRNDGYFTWQVQE